MSFAHFTPAGEHNEFRQHELHKRRLVMVDGNLMANDSSHLSGQSARAYQNGYWGFASATQPSSSNKLGNIALANAKAMQLFGGKSRPLPQEAYQGEHGIACKPSWSSEQLIEWLQSMTDLARSRYDTAFCWKTANAPPPCQKPRLPETSPRC